MREQAPDPPSGWKMEVFEVVPGLFIATRLEATSEYSTLGVDVIVDLDIGNGRGFRRFRTGRSS